MNDKKHLDNLKAIFLPEPFEAERDRGYLSSIPHILKEIYIDDVYSGLFLGRKDLVVLDIGAHIGLWSMFASRFCSKIYAFEPASDLYEILVKNIEYNGYKNVESLKIAIANADTKTTLFKGGQNTTANLLGDAGRGSEEVECWTLPTLFEKKGLEHVDVMKLDVEGAEFGIIGGDYFERVAPKIDFIVGEVHSWANRNYQNFYWSLKKRGYHVDYSNKAVGVYLARRV